MKWKKQSKRYFQSVGKKGERAGEGRNLAARGKLDVVVRQEEEGEGLIQRERNLRGDCLNCFFNMKKSRYINPVSEKS